MHQVAWWTGFIIGGIAVAVPAYKIGWWHRSIRQLHADVRDTRRKYLGARRDAGPVISTVVRWGSRRR